MERGRKIKLTTPPLAHSGIPIRAWGRSVYLDFLRARDRVASKLPAAGSFQPLRGWFSASRLLDEGNLKGAVLSEGVEPGPCPRGSVTEASGFLQHGPHPWRVFWTSSDSARLTGPLRIWRDERDMGCLEGNFGFTERFGIQDGQTSGRYFLPPPQDLPGAWTSIVSNWGHGPNYYHWLMDAATRLSVREHLPEETKIIVPKISLPFFKECLELLGIDRISSAPNHDNLRPERFYFVSPLAQTGEWNPLGCEWLRKRFASHRGPEGTGPPVFLTRRAKTRIPPQLPLVEEIFSRKGFKIVDCGTLTVREQIHMASTASAIAGIHGAAMTNFLWAAPGTPVLELFQPYYLNACYEQIAFQGKLDYQHLLLDHSDPRPFLDHWCSRL